MARLKTTVKFQTEIKDGSSVLSYTVKDGILEVKPEDAHHFYQHPLFHVVPVAPEKTPEVEAPKEEAKEEDPIIGDTPDEPLPEDEEEEEKPKKKKKKKSTKKKKKKEEE